MARKKAAAAPVVDVADDAEVDTALTQDDKDLCQNVVVFGPDYLRSSKGWTANSIRQFLARQEVVREVTNLKRQYDDRTGIQERTQFFMQLRVNAMVPAALNTIVRALRGTQVDANGTPVPGPTKQQFEAAQMVLERANIQGQKYNGNDQTPSIDARSVQIAIGGKTEDLSALGAEGRDRVRSLLTAIMGRSRAIAMAGDMTQARRDAESAKDAHVIDPDS